MAIIDIHDEPKVAEHSTTEFEQSNITDESVYIHQNKSNPCTEWVSHFFKKYILAQAKIICEGYHTNVDVLVP